MLYLLPQSVWFQDLYFPNLISVNRFKRKHEEKTIDKLKVRHKILPVPFRSLYSMVRHFNSDTIFYGPDQQEHITGNSTHSPVGRRPFSNKSQMMSLP